MGRGGLRAAEAREHLIAAGELFASSERLTGLLGVTAAQLPAALRRSVARGDFVRVCRGGWVVRDDRTRASGRRLPDLRAYIDAMMRHLGHLYYVGFNAAAAVHGAAHRRFTNTVVATSSRTTHRSLAAGLPPDGSMAVTYLHSRQPHRRGFTRRRMPESLYPAGTFVDYSTAEVTLLDMVQRPDLAGGLDHVCTVPATSSWPTRWTPSGSPPRRAATRRRCANAAATSSTPPWRRPASAPPSTAPRSKTRSRPPRRSRR